MSHPLAWASSGHFSQSHLNGSSIVTPRRIIAAACLIFVAAIIAFFAWHHHEPSHTATHAYADPASCVKCHMSEAAGYARTGMAQAFYSPTAFTTIDSPVKDRQFYHAASDTYYELTKHNGKFFEHRWQKGFDGIPDNNEELSIDSIMGSGNHVRTYLHREPDGSVIELPLAWYAEDGGHFGMNPGYDNAHPMTRRPIVYECMFCHNGYPEIPATAHRDLSANAVYTSLANGIDCQRCHGPGAAHVRAAQTPNTSIQQIDALILNPKRLTNDRQMEVCEQCHLETTSHLLPDRIRHYDQQPFGYDPTKLLASFNSYYTRDSHFGRTDNFEIVNAPYRLRQSQCYLQSRGALTCETCHNPHDLHKGPESASYYDNICMKCHGGALPQLVAAHKHPSSNDCVSCHMPQRRTEDVVHAIMTDHLIQRFAPPEKDRLASRQEVPDTPAKAYHGPVQRYLLDHEQPSPTDSLYNADAQVIVGSNLTAGIPALSDAINQHHPTQPNFSIELGDAMRHSGDLTGAISAYRDALKIDPLSSRAQRRLGVALGLAGLTDEALSVLSTAIDREPTNSLLFYERGITESRTGNLDKASADFHKALNLKPDFADAENNLGSALAQSGDLPNAEAAFRTALNINPYDSDTRANLGRLLVGKSDFKQAAFQLQKAIALDATNTRAHSDYAVVLLQLQRLPEAETQARTALAADAKSPRTHDLLGQVLAQKHQSAAAATEFRAALTLDPSFGPAQLDLAQTLLEQGHTHDAETYLEQATRSPIPAIAEEAHQLLQQLGPR
jgi:Flp pilus assembly protein TadD